MQCFAIPFKPPGPKIAKTVGYSNTTQETGAETEGPVADDPSSFVMFIKRKRKERREELDVVLLELTL